MPYLTRCDDCFYIFKSKNQVDNHTAAARHTPGRFTYVCVQCLPVQTFPGRAAAQAHKAVTGHLRGPQDVPASTGRPLHVCSECRSSFIAVEQLAVHRRLLHNDGRPIDATVEQVTATERTYEPPPSLQPIPASVHACPICLSQFADSSELASHVSSASASVCSSCKICVPYSQAEEDHYWESALHPKCRSCRLGFESVEAWAAHRESCFIDSTSNAVPEPDEYVQGLSMGARSPSSTLQLEDQVPRSSDATMIKHWNVPMTRPDDRSSVDCSDAPTEYSRTEVASATPPLSGPDRTHHGRTPSEQPRSVSSAQNVSYSRDVPPPIASPLRSAPSLKDGPTPNASSHLWHCRSCMRSPCIDPVTTICGHLFCQACILKELREHLSCPVCKKMFFV
ncbi:hypothetical protein C8Q76DRAFT_860096, partial [Earliella scabrosa]